MSESVSDEAALSLEQLYRTYQAYAFSIAYRMLGSVSDAEDAVQDLFADFQVKQRDDVKNMKAYLAKALTNRCLNLLQTATRRREVYTGEWLPEPLVEEQDGPLRLVERKDTLSYAYLVMLERLSPVERAVFLLREVFEYDYEEIAGILEKTAANCRKIFSRAKQHLGSLSADEQTQSIPVRTALIERFHAAFRSYDVGSLLEVLAEDAVLITDGGGNTRSAIHPLTNRERVIALLGSPKTFRKRTEWAAFVLEVNGETNLVYTEDEHVKAVVCFNLTSDGERIQNVYIVLNPEKLDHIQLNALSARGEQHS